MLLKSDAEYEVILVDAKETPIERPQKTKKILLRKKCHSLERTVNKFVISDIRKTIKIIKNIEFQQKKVFELGPKEIFKKQAQF